MDAGIQKQWWESSVTFTGFLDTTSTRGVWKITRVPIELDAILQEIDRALVARLYYLAIAVSLSIPDICACLECDPSGPIWANQDRYVSWCERNLEGRFKNVAGVDLFRLRGGVLHQGHFGHPKSRFDRIMFIGPESSIKMHDVIINVEPGVSFSGMSASSLRLQGRLLQLDAVRFCETIRDAARDWVVTKSNDPNVSANLQNLVRFRPEGLPPFSVGVPTIA
jgi:hypothetical protein